MEQRRKNLTQLFIPICLETLLYMLSGMIDVLVTAPINKHTIQSESFRLSAIRMSY